MAPVPLSIDLFGYNRDSTKNNQLKRNGPIVTAVADPEDNLIQLIDQLRQKIVKGVDATKIRTDDEFLKKFVRVRDYNVDRAYKSFKNFAKVLDYTKDYYKNGGRPSQFLPIYDSHIAVLLKGRSKVGARAMYANVRHWDPSQFTLKDLQLSAIYVIAEGLDEKETQLNGVCVVVDAEGVSLQHLKQITLSEIRMMITLAQQGLPMKISAIHLINFPSFLWPLFQLAQRFVKSKIRQRIYFHSTKDELLEYFDQDVLPDDIGGSVSIDEAEDTEFMRRVIMKDAQLEEYFRPMEFVYC